MNILRSFLLWVIGSLSLWSQSDDLNKTAPFQAVKWQARQPVVLVQNQWLPLVAIDGTKTEEIVQFCRTQFPFKWKKRFSEDLVPVLGAMGKAVTEEVTLSVLKEKRLKEIRSIYTRNNRQQVLSFNRKHKPDTKVVSEITLDQALSDIAEFEQIIKERSSYYRYRTTAFSSAIKTLKSSVAKWKQPIQVAELSFELAKIMALLGDRHSSVRWKGFRSSEYPAYTKRLPFAIVPYDTKVLALKKSENGWEYYKADFPFLEAINGVQISDFIDAMAYRSRLAPKEAKLKRGSTSLQRIGQLYVKNNLPLPEHFKFTFSNGNEIQTETLALTEERIGYYSQVEMENYQLVNAMRQGNHQGIYKQLGTGIDYLRFPSMIHLDEQPDLARFIPSKLDASNASSLIIDLRFNPGGVRDLIQLLSPYIVPPSESPWVANVAYLRTDEPSKRFGSMSSRYLYPKNAEEFNEEDREAIEKFSKHFTTAKGFEKTLFSIPHYMLLRNDTGKRVPKVYILVNEESFSAATVFTSAFKGLPNVQIVGVRTDGSSGNSKKIYLSASKIRVKVSTMLSFQRNGQTLDGVGTQPDIEISASKNQLLTGEDDQLKQLLEIIKAPTKR